MSLNSIEPESHCDRIALNQGRRDSRLENFLLENLLLEKWMDCG